MATGLETFDAFSWASLLAKRPTLVIDRDAGRCRRTAAAVEEAGAIATLAPGQSIGGDRLHDQAYRLVILALTGDEPVSEKLAPSLAALGSALVILADPARQAGLRTQWPNARIGGQGMSDRDLVMFITADADE